MTAGSNAYVASGPNLSGLLTGKRVLDVLATAVVAVSALTMFVIPLVFLVLHSVASSPVSGLHIPVSDMWSGLAWSTLSASLVAACTTLLGSVAALLTMLVPRPVARLMDVIAILPVTLSPFVIASAFKTALGRGSWTSDVLGVQADFTGLAPMLLSFVVALIPFAYAIARVAFSRIDPGAIDAARVLGSHGFGLLRLAVLPRMRVVLPLSWMVVFVLAISDPVVPSLVGGRVPNAARMVWLQMTALGDIRFAAQVSLMMLVPTAAWGLLFLPLLQPALLRRRRRSAASAEISPVFTPTTSPGAPHPHSTLATSPDETSCALTTSPEANEAPPTSRTTLTSSALYGPSLPVGSKSVSRSLLLAAIALLIAIPLVQILTNLSPQTTQNLRPVIGTTLILALISVLAAAIIAAAGLWLYHRLGRSSWIDALFGLAVAIPAATTGTGLATAYGPTSGLFGPIFTLAGASAPASGAIVIVMSYLTIAAPLTYFSARALTNLVPRISLEMAMVLGASPALALRAVALPWLRHVLTLSLAIVIAVSAVSVAPVMWVTSPATPLLVPHLFTLLDHASYPAAFTLALAGSLVVLVLVAVTFSTFGFRNRIGGHH